MSPEPSKEVPLTVLMFEFETKVSCLEVASPEYRELTALSPVLVPEEVPEPDGAPTILAVMPETVPVKVGELIGAKATLEKALEPSGLVRVFRLEMVAVRPVRFVAVAALPVVLPELPVTLPEIGLVTVRLVKVPTEVSEEERTFAAREVPERVPASAVTVMSALPLKETPLMFLALAKIVALAAVPLVSWFQVGTVPERIEYGTAVSQVGLEYEPVV